MAQQKIKGTLPHGFTLAFLHEELLDAGPAAQTVDALEFFQDLLALAAQFSGSGTGGLHQAMLYLNRYIIQLRLRPGLIGLKIWLHWRLRPQAFQPAGSRDCLVP